MKVFGVLLVAIQLALASEAPCLDLNDGNKMPFIALGTGRGTATGTNNDEVRDAVLWAIEAGYRHIDTASIYEDEEQVGQGIADAVGKGIVKREELFVTTKLWNDKHARDQVEPALKESLKKLGLDYVDLYLIHTPIATKSDGSPDDIDYLQTWEGMEDVKKKGLARSIGVSNFNKTQIDRLIANSYVKPAVNQVEVNPTLTQEDLVSHCQGLGVAIMGYSPLGYLVSRNQEDTPPPKYDDPAFLALGQKYKKNSGQIVLRYLLDRGIAPVSKSTNKNRIGQNIDIFDFKLTDEEVATISKFNKNIRVIDFSDYKDYPNFPFYN